MSPSLYVTKDGELVEEGDTRAARLAWREGGSVDESRLNTMFPGLAGKVRTAIAAQRKGASQEATEDKAQEAPPDDKAISAPDENKSRGRRSNN